MPRRHRDCRGKRKHPDRQSAIAARESLIRKRFAFRDTMRVYKCPHCGAWHLGHRRGLDGKHRRRR